MLESKVEEIFKQHIQEIISLTENKFGSILSYFNHRKIAKDHCLIEAGKEVDTVYFVLAGLLKLVYVDEMGREHIVAFAMENWWESDYRAFHTKSRATMSLICLEDTEVLCIDLENYQRLCSEFSGMEHFFLEKATKGHIAAQQRIISLLSLNARERYEFLMDRYPTLHQRVPKKLLAAYLGISRETLSRLSA